MRPMLCKAKKFSRVPPNCHNKRTPLARGPTVVPLAAKQKNPCLTCQVTPFWQTWVKTPLSSNYSTNTTKKNLSNDNFTLCRTISQKPTHSKHSWQSTASFNFNYRLKNRCKKSSRINKNKKKRRFSWSRASTPRYRMKYSRCESW